MSTKRAVYQAPACQARVYHAGVHRTRRAPGIPHLGNAAAPLRLSLQPAPATAVNIPQNLLPRLPRNLPQNIPRCRPRPERRFLARRSHPILSAAAAEKPQHDRTNLDHTRITRAKKSSQRGTPRSHRPTPTPPERTTAVVLVLQAFSTAPQTLPQVPPSKPGSDYCSTSPKKPAAAGATNSAGKHATSPQSNRSHSPKHCNDSPNKRTNKRLHSAFSHSTILSLRRSRRGLAMRFRRHLRSWLPPEASLSPSPETRSVAASGRLPRPDPRQHTLPLEKQQPRTAPAKSSPRSDGATHQAARRALALPLSPSLAARSKLGPAAAGDRPPAPRRPRARDPLPTLEAAELPARHLPQNQLPPTEPTDASTGAPTDTPMVPTGAQNPTRLARLARYLAPTSRRR